ncbi:sulfotransferase domain-containing protein [Oceanibium sediminis]|uniref:sulfotransferase domain-containing protein n=1 Tax=Oceanibium sediminis TaxID=2026339 RepID=UPI000DD493E1|nr:sulfotransferase domain-containing protein [Oceanibium sediminis]
MEPFLFISYGLTKSGSTLAFQLTSVALEQAGFPQPRLTVPGLVVSHKINAIEHVDEVQAKQVRDELTRLGGPIVVKTHTRPDPALVAMVTQGRAKLHVVVRDPRDIALSMLDNGRRSRARGKPAFSEFVTLADTFQGLDDQLRTLSQWAALPEARVLQYDTLAFDTVTAAGDILAHLGIPGDPGRIAEEVLNHRFTQRNVARRDRHRSEMPAADSAAFLTRYADFHARYLAPAPTGASAGVASPLTQ